MSKPWETYRAGGITKLRRRPVRYQHTTSATNPPPSNAVTVASAAGTETGITLEEGEFTPVTDYATLRKGELVALADERGLDSSGTRADLIARLEDA